MDAVTYPDGALREILTRSAVPVRLNILQEREAAKRLRAVWTPTFLYLDAEGREAHRALGYLPPEHFAAQVLVGAGMTHFQSNQFDRALACFEEALEKYPRAHAAPEALYWRGVCGFRKSKETRHIYDACRQIVARYPGTEWATKLGFVGKYPDFNFAGK